MGHEIVFLGWFPQDNMLCVSVQSRGGGGGLFPQENILGLKISFRGCHGQ